MKLAVFSSKKYWMDSFNRSMEHLNAKVEITYFDMAFTAQNAKIAKGYDGVCCFVNDQLGRDSLQELKNVGVKLVLLRCAGTNTLDVEAAKEFGITVARVPAYSPFAVADFTISLMLTLNRHTHRAYNRVRENNFEIAGLMGFDMRHKTVGIIGTGKIGTEVCRILKGFQCKLIAYDVYESQECKDDLGVKYVTIDEIWKQSDIITLHTPLLKETKYMVNRETIAKMKKGVMLINVSRGALINTKDVIDGLKSGQLGYLGIDVYEEESNYFFEDNSNENGIQDDVLSRLTTFPNVIVTSHQAWFTREAISEICNITLSNLLSFPKNLQKENLVVPPSQ